MVEAGASLPGRTEPAGPGLNASDVSSRRWEWRFLLPPIADDGSIWLAAASPVDRDEAAAVTGRQVAVSPADAETVVVIGGGRAEAGMLRARFPAAHTAVVTVDRLTLRNLVAFPARVRRTLEGQGFRQFASYWAKPSLPAPSGWVPLGSRPVLRWYLETGLRRRNVVLRWAAWAGLRWPRLATLVLELIVPAYAIVATRCAAEEGVETGSSEATPAAARLGGDERISATAIVAGGERPWSRVTFMPFSPASSTPSRCIKMPRLAVYNQAARHEQEVLGTLAATSSPLISTAVPRALGTVEERGLVLALESYVHGAGLHLLLNEWPHERHGSLHGLRLATEWLVALARSTAKPLTPESLRAIALDPLEEFAATLPVTAGERELLSSTAIQLAGWAGGNVPEVLLHSDFGPWNVLLEGDRVFVIDWESASAGMPLGDLLYLLLHSIWQTRRGRDVARESRDVIDLIGSEARNDPLFTESQSCIDFYLHELGLDRQVLRPLLVVALVQQALDQRHRLLALELSDRGRVDDRYDTYLRALAQEASARRNRPAKVVAA